MQLAYSTQKVPSEIHRSKFIQELEVENGAQQDYNGAQ